MKNRNVRLELAVAGLLLASGTAQGQSATTSAAPATTLDEVVVTATKREEKLHDVAMSITAVTGEDMLRRIETGFTDFAAQVPGLAIEALDAGTNRIILRGQNVGSVGATVATTVDDIPFFMSGAQADGSFFSANVDTWDLKRVEVLRGPQGTLYGAAAEGGLIKYVTNAPDLTRTEGAVTVGGETVQDGQSAGFLKGLVNLPFWDNKAALRVSAVQETLPGWIDNPVTGQKDINHGEKYSVRGSLLVAPTSDLTIRLTAFNQGLTVHGDNGVEVIGAAATPTTPPANQFDLVDGFSRGGNVEHRIENALEYYALNVDYAFHAATLMSATSYGKIRYRTTGDFTNDNLAPGVTYGDYLGSFFAVPVAIQENEIEFVHKFNQEFRLTSNPGTTVFGKPLDWVLGAFYTREATDLNQPLNGISLADGTIQPTVVNGLLLGGGDITASYKETAYFADVTYHFAPAFDIELGGRSTLTQQHQHSTFTGLLYQGGEVFGDLYSSQTSTTWSVAPRWHITSDVLMYARFATGFRPGGPNIPTPTLPMPPAFLADSTRNYELGLRADLLGRAVTIDVAAFDVEWKNIQILEEINTPSGPVGINGNAGNARSSGLEWNLAWRPTSALSIGLLGAYTDAKLTLDAPGIGGLSGDKLPYVPDVSATLNVDYTWSAFSDYKAFAGASWTYTGTRYSGFSSNGGVIEDHAKLPTYNALNLRLGLDNGRYTIELFGNNLTNSRGITEYTSEGGVNQTGVATVIQPKTLGLQLGAKF